MSKEKLITKLILLVIVLLAAFLRFYDLNWDQGHHLHPDERFLTMVSNNMHLPTSFSEYINSAKSPFNPANVGYPFFVYGAFPLIGAKLLAPLLNSDTYDTFTLLGRALSAFADTFVVLLIFKSIDLFKKRYKFHQSIKFWAAGFYALSVLPIQLAHFFAVDTFLNLFLFAAFYCITEFAFRRKIVGLLLSAFFLGLAVASKITAIFMIPLLLVMLIPGHSPKQYTFRQFKKAVFLLIIYGLIFYGTLRISDPYLFQNPTLLDPQPNILFMQNLQTLKNLSDPTAWFPPALQWLHKLPVIFALKNIMFYGLGIPLFLCTIFGMGIILFRFRKTKLLMLLIWCLLFFLYQSTQITKTMRYFITLYPFFALFAAFGFYYLTKRFHMLFISLLVIPIVIWPLSFFSIYTKPHSRVQASIVIDETIPTNSVILSEHWDDALPLSIPNKNNTYTIKELPVFGEDTPQKWNEMNMLLSSADYLILSSNRGWGSILSAPERYPLMSKFYANLFANKLAYKKILTITSYPSLTYLGIPLTFPDDDSEEAFTVYDHPKILIFKNTQKLTE